MGPVIAVCGSDGDDSSLSASALSTAEAVGRLIAQRGGILICGGRSGVMQAACKGAKSAQGLTVGILPDSKEEANEFVDVKLPTGLGNMRNFVIVHSADVVIMICGRWGTLNEMTYAMMLKKPCILIKGTGGCVDDIASGRLLSHVPSTYVIALSAEDAVEKAFAFCKE